MVAKNLIFYVSCIFVAAGCSFTTLIVAPVPKRTAAGAAMAYRITEDFETSSKAAYAAADITTPAGSWTLENAVIGSLPADLKHGKKSLRMKTGRVTMNYDVTGLRTLYISHGKYGSDAGSTWKLLISIDAGKTFTQVGKEIVENNSVLVTDSFQVVSTGRVRFQIQNNGSTASARINLDDISFIGDLDPGVKTGVSAPAAAAAASTARTRGVEAGPDAEPSAGDDSNLLFGNPSGANGATPDNFYLDQRYYAQSYSSSRSTPNWVSWHLDASNTTNVSTRLDNFAGYNGLPQDFYIVQSSSYSGSGFDRGHNCPSADRTSSAAANGATFLMTNMVPQAPRNNQRTWANFENYLRTQVDAGNEVYIIMGSYGTGGIGSKGLATTIDNGKVTVPSNLWKVAVILPQGDGDLRRVNATTRIIAINTENNNGIDPDWKKYIVSVRDIEKATGYNLMSSLSRKVQNVVEVKKDAGL
jgi:endonuclease G